MVSPPQRGAGRVAGCGRRGDDRKGRGRKGPRLEGQERQDRQCQAGQAGASAALRGRRLNGKPALRFTEKAATRLELPDLSEGKITVTVFAVFSNPVAGDKRNASPRIFTASDGRQYDYRVGVSLNVRGLETGGPRQIMAAFEDRWAKKVRVGCFSPNYQTYFTGDIGEILVYRRALTPEEKEQVNVYLFSKWGLY